MKMDGTTKTNYLLVFLTVFSCSLSIFNHIRYNDLKAEQEFKSPKESSIRTRRSAELAETFYPSSTPYPTQDEGNSNLFKNIGEIKTLIGKEVNSILDERLKDGDKCRCSDNGSQRSAGGPKGPKGERGERGLPGPPGPRGPRGLGLYPPQIKENKLNINATKGNSTIFTCQFFGNPLPNITWNSRISDKEIKQSIDRELSVVTSQLHARNLKWSDRGVVKCSASNILGTEYRIGTLLVLAPPRIILRSNTVIGMVGTTITFPHCRVNSDPKYNITWERGFPGLPQHRTYNVDGLLRISRLKIQDQGYYKCIAKNYLGTESKYVFLQVSEFKFTKKPDPYIYQSNNSVLLTCGTYGSAGLEGKWLRSDGKPLPSVTENKYKYDKYEMLVSTKVKQSGRYRCVISNGITSIETSTMVELFSLNSSLLNDTQVNTLGKWMVERNSHDKYKLCWSGSKHGFNSSIFRSRCGGKSNTITIIRTNNDTVVGGYSDIPWISDENLQTSNIEKEKDCGDKITSPGKYKVSFKKSSSCKVNFELSEASTIEILSAYFKEKFCSSNYIKVMNTIKYYGEKYCVSDIGKGKLFNLGLGSGTIEYQRSLFYRAEYHTFTFTIMIRTVQYRFSSLSFIYALQPTEILSPVEENEKAICDFENFGVCFGRMDLSYHEKSIKISHVDSYKRSIVLFGVDPFKRGKYSVKDIEVHYKV